MKCQVMLHRDMSAHVDSQLTPVTDLLAWNMPSADVSFNVTAPPAGAI